MKEKNFISVPNLGYPDASAKSSLFPYVGWNYPQKCFQIQMQIQGRVRQFPMKFLDQMGMCLEQQDVIFIQKKKKNK